MSVNRSIRKNLHLFPRALAPLPKNDAAFLGHHPVLQMPPKRPQNNTKRPGVRNQSAQMASSRISNASPTIEYSMCLQEACSEKRFYVNRQQQTHKTRVCLGSNHATPSVYPCRSTMEGSHRHKLLCNSIKDRQIFPCDLPSPRQGLPESNAQHVLKFRRR